MRHIHNPARWPLRIWFLAVFAIAIATGTFFFFTVSLAARSETRTPSQEPITTPGPDPATETAIALAQSSLEALLGRQSQTLAQAMARYSLKAGRPPPPNFEMWFEFAQKKGCLIDEYDQIQRDLEPFYQIAMEQPTYFQYMVDKGRAMILNEAKGLTGKKQAAIGMAALGIKNGKLQPPPYRATVYYEELLRTIRRFAYLLPDQEFLLNGRDEPRVVFNFRQPGASSEATRLKDLNPFHIAPLPTDIFFKNQSGCDLFSKANGFALDESGNIAFLRSSSTSDFTTDLWPLLSMTKLSSCFSDVLFPSPYHYRGGRWSLPLKPNDILWNDKKSQLYWRGASNGGHIIGENYRSFPRFRLIEIARAYPELIDAKMTRFAEGHCTDDCDREHIIKDYNITGPGAARSDSLAYKYVLDVDGNTFSGRFLNLLKSGSLVFKSTVFEEYFNDWIRPYEHYIPLKPDLSDLVERIHWAMAHEAEARLMQETGKLFAERIMTDSQNDCYFAAVLLEWGRLQSYANTGNDTGAGL